jgi:sulfide dehydrogenase cytochrome subunit
MKKLLPIMGLSMLVSAPAMAIERGEIIATTCFSCHGYEGKNTGSAIPSLANYPASLIVSQMKAFRDGTRQSTVMNRHAKGYTDEEIEAMAKYIGKQGL